MGACVRILIGLSAAGLVAAMGHSQLNVSRTKSIGELMQEWTYLAPEFVDDGCSARAYYISLELAVQGYPSSHWYIYPPDQQLFRVAGAEWNYHVATTFTNAAGPWVLDPVLSAQPIAADGYLSLLSEQHPAFVRRIPGSSYLRGSALLVQDQLGAGFAIDWPTMGLFKLSDISHACGLLNSYIDRQRSGSPQALEEQRQILRARSQWLISALEYQGLLDADAEFDCQLPLDW